MDTTNPPSEETKEQTTTVDAQPVEASVRPEYGGDKGAFVGGLSRDDKVEKKTVATFSFGNRVRIAALSTPQHEQMLDHIIEVAGWARTMRMGGKDFAFIELTDGSGAATLQCVIDSTMPNFAQVAKMSTGASFKIKGKLIKSPAKGQLVEL